MLLCLLLCSSLPWDKDYSYFQSRTADTKPWMMLGMLWFKNHINPPVLVTARPNEGERPTSALGTFRFTDTAVASTLISLSLQNMKGTWKSNATRLQQLQQSECINDQQMIHKVWAPNRDPKWCREKGSRWRTFRIQAVLEKQGKSLDFAKSIV